MKTYKMTIAGLERELPICAAGPNLDIAAFVIFGDVEITVASAKALLEKCPRRKDFETGSGFSRFQTHIG